jgi:hypothetical protein
MRAQTRPDPLRRFSSTPLASNLQLMGRTVRIETNDEAVLDLAWKFFERYRHGKPGIPEFTWRLISEPDPKVPSTAVHVSAFSDPGLQYVNIGHGNFLAVDLDRREAIGFLSDGPRLSHRPPLDILFCMSAASLGLVALSGGCVGLTDRGVLVFGPPNSGKTTACYLAAKLGMEFHADQVVFLEMNRNVFGVWGDYLPAVFRPDTLDFLPELRRSARRSAYADVSFYYFDKSPLQAREARPVVPVCSLFLDRGVNGETRLTEIGGEDTFSRLRDSMLFDEEPRFEANITEALLRLAEQPAYHLQYGSDPKTAAAFIERMLR